MKQEVVVVASEEGMSALLPAFEQAQGIVLEHVKNPEWAAKRLTEATPELLILVHPLPEYETVKFWRELNERLGAAIPQTVVVAAPADLFDLEPLQESGVRLVNLRQSATSMISALSAFLRKSPRPHARVMVKVAVEVGAGKILRIAQTVNVSRSGLLLRTQEVFPIGATLDLKMELPGDKAPIEARAEVVRLADPGIEEVRGVGARFEWFRGSDEKRFDEFMRRAVIDSVAGQAT